MTESNQNSKLIAKNTLLLYIRMLVSMGISLYTSRLILSALGVEDFGIYNVVGSAVALFSFITTSMSGATARFITFALGAKQDVQRVFSNTLTLHFIIAAIVVVLAESIGLWFLNSELNIPADRVMAAHLIFQFSIVGTAFTIIQTPYTASIIAKERISTFAYIDILNTALRLVVVLLLVNYSFSDNLVAFGAMIMGISIVVFFVYYIYCTKRLPFCRYRFEWNLAEIRPMLSFSGWDLYGNLSVVARTQGVNMLLNIFFGAVLNAASGIATQVQSAVMSFASNIVVASKPQIIKSFAAGHYHQTIKLVIDASKFSFILLLLITLPLIANIEYILSLWLKDYPEFTAIFCQLTLLFNLFASLSFVVVTAIHATGKIMRPSIINGSLYLLVIPISYLSFKLGGSPTTAYIFNIGAVVLGMLSNVYTLQLHLPTFRFTHYLFRLLLPCGVVGTVSTALVYLSLQITQSDLTKFLLSGTISTLSIVTLSLFILFGREERAAIIRIIRNKIYGKRSN